MEPSGCPSYYPPIHPCPVPVFWFGDLTVFTLSKSPFNKWHHWQWRDTSSRVHETVGLRLDGEKLPPPTPSLDWEPKTGAKRKRRESRSRAEAGSVRVNAGSSILPYTRANLQALKNDGVLSTTAGRKQFICQWLIGNESLMIKVNYILEY